MNAYLMCLQNSLFSLTNGFFSIMNLEDSGIDQLSLALKQLTVSECSPLWSQPLGYAITSNRTGSSELKENAWKGLASARPLFCLTVRQLLQRLQHFLPHYWFYHLIRFSTPAISKNLHLHSGQTDGIISGQNFGFAYLICIPSIASKHSFLLKLSPRVGT